MMRQPSPSERLIAKAIWLRWRGGLLTPGDGFNMIVSRAASACGVSYDRAWWVACRTWNRDDNEWLFPCGGVGVGA